MNAPRLRCAFNGDPKARPRRRKPSARMADIALLIVLLAGFGIAPPPCLGDTIPPALFFTDLESGPNTGGQDDLGVFITIWGEGFGAGRGDSTVTLGGREVARYVIWGADNAAARGLDMIVIQPGPAAVTGDLVVNVEGRPSNPLPFTVRAGQIYFVIPGAPNASDANPGTFAQPFQTIYHPRTVMQAGDVVYLRGGAFNQLDPNNPGWDTILSLDADDATTGSASRPVAWIGYPGEAPTLGDPLARRGVLMLTSSGNSYYVIANMIFTQSQNPISLYGAGHRVVGNVLHDGAFDDTGAISIDGECTGFRIFGNLLQRNGSPGEKLHHAVYLGGYGANTDIDIGWNQIEDQHGGRAIQLFGHLDGDRIDRVRIHDNLIAGSELNNIVIGGTDGNSEVIGAVEVFNNLIVGAGEEGLRVNDPNGTITIQNNVLHNNALAQILLQRAGTGRITLENNIISAGTGQSYCEFDPATSPAAFNAQRNIYYNAGAAPAWDSTGINADPLFVNAAASDFHLQQLSPAVDAGIDSRRSRDYDGTTRPQGAAYDLGAYEFPQVRAAATSWILY